MRNVFIVIGVLTWVSCQPAEEAGEAPEAAAPTEASSEVDPMDATNVAPEHYQVELENEHVRVLRISYAAGDESAMHSHPDGVIVFLNDGSGVMTLEDGTSQETGGNTGDAIWADAATHSFKAESDTEVVLVELKGSGGETAIPDTNATVVDADNHKVEFENDKVRIVRMTYPVGHQTPPHTHLPGVNVTLAPSKGTNQTEGGELNEFEGEANQVNWADAGPAHVTTSTGENEFSIIRVEIKGVPSEEP